MTWHAGSRAWPATTGEEGISSVDFVAQLGESVPGLAPGAEASAGHMTALPVGSGVPLGPGSTRVLCAFGSARARGGRTAQCRLQPVSKAPFALVRWGSLAAKVQRAGERTRTSTPEGTGT